MGRSLAQFFSLAIHPIAMPAIALLLARIFDPYLRYFLPAELFDPVFYVVLANTILLPAVSIYFLYKREMIGSIDLGERRDRFLPFLVTFLFYTTTYILLRQVPLPDTVFSLFFGALVALFIGLLLTLVLKVSVHMIGISGVLGGIVGLFHLHDFFSLGLLSALILAVGILGTSRLKLGAHRPVEVFVGTLVGFVGQYLIVSQELFL